MTRPFWSPEFWATRWLRGVRGTGEVCTGRWRQSSAVVPGRDGPERPGGVGETESIHAFNKCLRERLQAKHCYRFWAAAMSKIDKTLCPQGPQLLAREMSNT